MIQNPELFKLHTCTAVPSLCHLTVGEIPPKMSPLSLKPLLQLPSPPLLRSRRCSGLMKVVFIPLPSWADGAARSIGTGHTQTTGTRLPWENTSAALHCFSKTQAAAYCGKLHNNQFPPAATVFVKEPQKIYFFSSCREVSITLTWESSLPK